MSLPIEISENYQDDYDVIGAFEASRQNRLRILDRVMTDMFSFGKQQGFSNGQIRGAIESLFRTFINEWSLWEYSGADDLVTAIQNDATLSWLDLDASGQTIRQRLVNRLS
jgi:hypothetical protein